MFPNKKKIQRCKYTRYLSYLKKYYCIFHQLVKTQETTQEPQEITEERKTSRNEKMSCFLFEKNRNQM